MASGEQGRNGGQSGMRRGDAARAERLRKALRENLRRRKVQAKDRSTERSKEPAVEGSPAGADANRAGTHDSAGFVPEKAPDKPEE